MTSQNDQQPGSWPVPQPADTVPPAHPEPDPARALNESAYRATDETSPRPAAQPSETAVETFERPHPLTPLVDAWIMVAAAAVFIARELFINGDIAGLTQLSVPTLAFIAIIVIQIVIGVFRWRYVRFVVGTEEFRIEQNFIWHHSDKIPYSKIQSVDIQQPFAARILRMATLHIDVGSEAGKRIEHLSLKRAEQLREILLLRTRAPHLSGQAAASDSISPPDLSQPSSALPDYTRSQVSDDELAVFQAKPSHLVLTAILSFDFLFLLVTQVVALVTGQLTGIWGPSAALMFPLIGMLWHRTTSQWNYRLTRHGTTVRSSRGMFTLASQQIPRQRVQGIRISQRLLHRILGLWRVQMTVLGVGHQQDASERSNILLPAGKWADVKATVAAIWPGLDLETFEWSQQPPAARWLTWFTFKTRGWHLGNDIVATRRGLLVHRMDLVPYARVQGLELVQGPLRRQFGLAAVNIQLSTGVVNGQAGHLEWSSATTLLDELSERGRRARETDLVAETLLSYPPPAPAQIRRPAE